MSEERKVTKVTTGTVRFSYLHVFEPWAAQEGQEKRYSVCLLIPKSDKKTLSKIKEAIEAAKKEGAANKFKGKTAGLKLPLRDGDEERADDYPEYTGMYFMNANSNRKLILLDQDNNEILDQTEMYSGCWGQASINFFPFNSNGNKGIAVGLNALKKKRDDEPLGGTITVDSAISDFEDSDDGFDDDLLG